MGRLSNFIVLSLFVFSQDFRAIVCINIPLEWLSHLQEMTRKFDAEPWSPVCVPHSIILTIEQRAKISSNGFPNIIFWDPLVQFPELATTLSKCVGDNCGEVMKRREWQDRQNTALMPHVFMALTELYCLLAEYMFATLDTDALVTTNEYLSAFHLLPICLSC